MKGRCSTKPSAANCRPRQEPSRNQSIDRKLGNQQNGPMKTTLDLPDALVKQVKIRAVREGRKLKEMVADLLRKGLASSIPSKVPAPPLKRARITTDPVTCWPLIVCASHAP